MAFMFDRELVHSLMIQDNLDTLLRSVDKAIKEVE